MNIKVILRSFFLLFFILFANRMDLRFTKISKESLLLYILLIISKSKRKNLFCFLNEAKLNKLCESSLFFDGNYFFHLK
jgi:hypothetical protein